MEKYKRGLRSQNVLLRSSIGWAASRLLHFSGVGPELLGRDAIWSARAIPLVSLFGICRPAMSCVGQ